MAPSVPATTIAFKRVENQVRTVLMEADPAMLFYVKMATLLKGMRTKARVRERHRCVEKDVNVRWRKLTKTWVSFRVGGCSRTFRPTDDDDVDGAFESAKRWAAGEDVELPEPEEVDNGSDGDGDADADGESDALLAGASAPGEGAPGEVDAVTPPPCNRRREPKTSEPCDLIRKMLFMAEDAN